MREFDFDELDRAVNSVLNKEATGRSAEAVPEQQPSQLDATERPQISSHPVHSRLVPAQRGQHRQALRRRNDAVVPAEPVEQSEANPAQTPATAVSQDQEQPAQQAVAMQQKQTSQPRRPVAPRQSGRFMDMVHPSSDMSASAVKKTPTQPLKPTFEAPVPARQQSDRKAPVEEKVEAVQTPDQPNEIEKVVNDLLVDEVSNVEVRTNSLDEKEAPAARLGEQSADTATQSADDVLQNQSTIVDKNISPASIDTAFEMPSPDDPDSVGLAPQTSPFLTDAQVQKRPLGANRALPTDSNGDKINLTQQSQVDTQTERSSEVDKLHTKIQAIESIEADTPQVQTPSDESVFSDLSLESENTALSEVPVAQNSAVSTDKAPFVNKIDQTSVLSPAPEHTPESSKPVVTGPSSIARQYKETSVETSEDDTNPIFDPENYRQPLEHQPKKKSGWGWVIAIITLILVGAAAVALLWQSGLLVVPL